MCRETTKEGIVFKGYKKSEKPRSSGMNLVVDEARACDGASLNILWALTNLFATIPGMREDGDRLLRSGSDLRLILGEKRLVQIVSNYSIVGAGVRCPQGQRYNADNSWLNAKPQSFVDAMRTRKGGHLFKSR
jgi:hypothetical protein